MSLRGVLGITAAVSACSMVYQMAIAAAFVAMTGDDILWQSVTIAIYLAALGLGTFAAGRLRSSDPYPPLFRVELALSALGTAVIPAICVLETAYRIYFRFYRAADAPPSDMGPYMLMVLACHAFTVAIGFLSGFEVPLLLKAAGKAGAGDKDRLTAVLSVNYFGALIGTLLFSVVLLPRLDLFRSALGAAGVNLAVCALLTARGRAGAGRAAPAGIAGVAVLAGALAWLSGPLDRFFLVNYYASTLGIVTDLRPSRAERMPSLREIVSGIAARSGSVERRRSLYQNLDLLQKRQTPSGLAAHYNKRIDKDPGFPQGLMLYLDRRYQFYGANEAIYHENLAHVPIQAFDNIPEDVLILGGGDGMLARELLKYGDRVKSITNIELDPAMIRLAREDPRLVRLNGGAFLNPKVRVLADDAFYFARNCRDKFDAIYIDFPYPYSFNLTRLYSVEFFRQVARLLEPEGFVAIDYPINEDETFRPDDDEEEEGSEPLVESASDAYRENSLIVNTLEAAGFKTFLPFNSEAPELITETAAQLMGVPSRNPDPEISRRSDEIALRNFRQRFPDVPLPAPADKVVVISNKGSLEAMLAFTLEDVDLDFEWKDHGIPLYHLNKARYELLEDRKFPYTPDPGLVNSIFRPRLFKASHMADFAFE